MKIKDSILQAWLDSVTEKQADNVRFIPVEVRLKIKRNFKTTYGG